MYVAVKPSQTKPTYLPAYLASYLPIYSTGHWINGLKHARQVYYHQTIVQEPHVIVLNIVCVHVHVCACMRVCVSNPLDLELEVVGVTQYRC